MTYCICSLPGVANGELKAAAEAAHVAAIGGVWDCPIYFDDKVLFRFEPSSTWVVVVPPEEFWTWLMDNIATEGE